MTLLVAMTLAAADYSRKLESARAAIASPAKSTVWKGYHDYQSLYMKGLLDGDRKLQIEALEGLVKASKKLGLDPTRYYNALQTLRPASQKRRASPEKKKATTSASPGKKASVELLESGGKRRKILKTKVEANELILRLDRPLPARGVRHFVLKKKSRYLYVFDISPARLPYSIKRIKGEGFREIRIAQYDPRKVRVVVETLRRYKTGYKAEGDTIRIALPDVSGSGGKKSALSKAPKPAVVGSSSGPASLRPKEAASSAPGEKGVMSQNRLPRRYTVVIDPGHGGRDAGAVGYRRKKEKDAVLAVAKELKKELLKRGFNVYLTRSRDVFIPLKKRTRYANRKQADFFISIHANAAPKRSHWNKSRGIETYFLSRARTGRAKRVAAIENSAEVKNVDRFTKEAYLSLLNREKIIESNKLAIDLQRQMLSSVRSRYKDVVDNGVREGPFWVLVGAQMPAVLIEIGYITNPTEAKRLFTTRYRKLLAEGIANGIQSYIYHNQ